MLRTKRFLTKCGKGGIITMNKKQYNNVIENTLKQEQTAHAEKAGYKEISVILKLILFGSSINEMAVTDKVVKIQFSVGAGVYESKTVFDSNGNFKFQEHST